MTKYTRCEKRDGVATITMDDPSTGNANSTPHIIDELCKAIEDVNNDTSIGAVIFTGAGSIFSSGGEIKMMESYQRMTPVEIRSFYIHSGIHRLTRALSHLELPTIAAVNGPAYGSGFGMALMCDIRIASTEASFTMNFAKLGILPGDGGAWYLIRAVGSQQAARILFGAQPVRAEEALSLGLVLQVVAPEDLMSVATGLATDYARNSKQNLRLMKRMLRHAHRTDWDAFVDMTVSMQALSHCTQEHRDGLAALKERVANKTNS